MKRNFVKLFVVFGILLCIFALFGCEFIEFEPETGEESRESISQTKETLPDDEETSDEEESSEIETDETTGELTDSSFVPDEELIEAVIDYLEGRVAEKSGPDTYFKMTDQIDQINRGAQPLQIEFDPDKYYYVCAYYSPEHSEEDVFYCCAAEYIWVGFSNEENIVEYYNDTKLLVAIQINKTKLCIDILYDDRNIPEVEHFQVYSPIFVDGVNTAKSITFDDKMIYLNSTDATTVYTCWSYIYHDFLAMHYVKLDSRNYIVYDHTEHVDNVANKEKFKGVFGNYYDQLIEIMITDKYYIENSKGEKIYYGIFEIEEFFNTITK